MSKWPFKTSRHLLLKMIAVIGLVALLCFALLEFGSIARNTDTFHNYGPSKSLVDIGAGTDQRLARTRSIIRSSTVSDPKVLKILFYGQSITSPKWTDLAGEYLRQKYPNTRFLIRNMAIGGFAAQFLERTTARDVSDFYPDLIVLHVYGDHRAYERIIRTMRSISAAEIIVETDHLTGPAEPLCKEGFHMTLRAPPGCKGLLWYRQRSWEEHMSGVVLPYLADKYGLAIEPRRERWAAYINAQGITPQALLSDTVHPNEAGWQLAAHIFEEYFDSVVSSGTELERSDLTSTLPLPVRVVPIMYEFSGNRVELISRGPLDGLVTTRIDGLPPELIEGCWQITRTNNLPGVHLHDWPVIRKVTVFAKPYVPETWIATITNLSSDQTDFDFTVHAEMAGGIDHGRGRQDFYSTATGTKIEAKDWSVPLEGVYNGFQVIWSREFVCHDESETLLSPGQLEVRHLMVTGLPLGEHSLKIEVSDAALGLIKEIRVYAPPLVQYCG